MPTVLGGVATLERHMITRRTNEGRKRARDSLTAHSISDRDRDTWHLGGTQSLKNSTQWDFTATAKHF
jgi:hypothetical protein